MHHIKPFKKIVVCSPVWFLSGCLLLSQTLHPSGSSVCRLPLTCWHLQGASPSHLVDSSYYCCCSICDGNKKDFSLGFLALVLLAGAGMLGQQLGCCRGFVEQRTAPPPAPHLPPPPH